MKKFRIFSIIATIICTLMMTVACDSSAAASKVVTESELVEVSLNLNASRSLTSRNPINTYDIAHIAYTMTAQWDGEDIYGELVNEELPADGKLGWVTPGFWEVRIDCYNEEMLPIYTGSETVYFSSKNTSVTVALAPYEANGNISISIDQPMLSDNNYEYNYVYALRNAAGQIAKEGVLPFVSRNNNVGKYELAISNVAYGEYALTIACYRNDSNASSQENNVATVKAGELIGGETRGIAVAVLCDEEVRGSVDYSDFQKPEVEVESITVSGTMDATVLSRNGKTSQISFNLTDTTEADPSKSYEISYQWYVNGCLIDGLDALECDVAFNTYGPKEVSCVIIYKESSSKIYVGTVKTAFEILPGADIF